MAQDMTLLWFSGSPPCWRLMIAVEEKNLRWTLKHITFSWIYGYISKIFYSEYITFKSQ
uniref:GST N-terminal domain-containing protein n=1 Tax=Sphaeramia orbicularis TaxID=375764 RepID=A0A673BN50_9TELE